MNASPLRSESPRPARIQPPPAQLPFQPPPFQPRRFLHNGHLQTIAGNFLPRAEGGSNPLPPPETNLVQVSSETAHQMGSQVLCHCHWQPMTVRADRMTVIVLHGLEGSSRSQYVLGNARKLWAAGMNVVRMNMRNCGGTEALTPTLYHSGLSGDVLAVLQFFTGLYGLRETALVGYSMGGNLVLKLTGELGADPPPSLRAVVGVSPALDLGPSADALHGGFNRVYEHRFLRALTGRFRRKARLFPRVYDPARADGLRSLREFDDRITALYAGFRGAEDYYFRASAARVLDRITVPTLVLHAADDPFVRITPESRAAIAGNPAITLLEPAHGGHCAFLAQPAPARGQNGDLADQDGYGGRDIQDGYWAESTLLAFLNRYASTPDRQSL